MAPKNKNGRPAASCVSACDIFTHWQKLDTKQRGAALHFTDTELVACIVEALQHLQRQHEACLAAGFSLTSVDPFKNSPLLGDILFISMVHRTAKDDTTRTETDFRLQIKEDFLEGDDLFKQLQSVLPDFLEPRSKSRRSPLPRQHWKRLWDTMPASFHALEQQMAKTMEQAFWAMAVAASQTKQAESASARLNVSPVDDIVEESWMIEPVPKPMTAKATKKQRETKRKKHGSKEVHAGPRQEPQGICGDVMTVSKSDLVKHDEQLSHCSEAVHTEIHGQSFTEAVEVHEPHEIKCANIGNSKLVRCEALASESSDDQALITKERRNFSDVSTSESSDDQALITDERNCSDVSTSESSDDQALITKECKCSDVSTMSDVHSDTAGFLAEDSPESCAAGERFLLEAAEALADLGMSEMEPPAAIMPEQVREPDCLAGDLMIAAGYDVSSNKQIICSCGEPFLTHSTAPVTDSLSADQLLATISDGPPGLDAPPGLLAPWLLMPPHARPDVSWPENLSLLQNAMMQDSAELSGLAPLALPVPQKLLAPPGLLQPSPSCLQ